MHKIYYGQKHVWMDNPIELYDKHYMMSEVWKLYDKISLKSSINRKTIVVYTWMSTRGMIVKVFGMLGYSDFLLFARSHS